MAQVIEAIYTHGVLEPKGKLALRESQRVRLIVEPLDEDPRPRRPVRGPAAAHGGNRGDEVLLRGTFAVSGRTACSPLIPTF